MLVLPVLALDRLEQEHTIKELLDLLAAALEPLTKVEQVLLPLRKVELVQVLLTDQVRALQDQVLVLQALVLQVQPQVQLVPALDQLTDLVQPVQQGLALEPQEQELQDLLQQAHLNLLLPSQEVDQNLLRAVLLQPRSHLVADLEQEAVLISN